MITQDALILHHLQTHGPITPLLAMQKYGIMRLGARVWSLKKLGWRIKSEMVEVPTRGLETARVAQYTLENP